MKLLTIVRKKQFRRRRKPAKIAKFLLKSAYPNVKILESILTSSGKSDQTLINKIK